VTIENIIGITSARETTLSTKIVFPFYGVLMAIKALVSRLSKFYFYYLPDQHSPLSFGNTL